MGAEDPDVATSLGDLANLYKTQGKYKEALPLFVRAMKIMKELFRENHVNVLKYKKAIEETERKLGRK